MEVRNLQIDDSKRLQRRSQNTTQTKEIETAQITQQQKSSFHNTITQYYWTASAFISRLWNYI